MARVSRNRCSKSARLSVGAAPAGRGCAGGGAEATGTGFGTARTGDCGGDGNGDDVTLAAGLSGRTAADFTGGGEAGAAGAGGGGVTGVDAGDGGTSGGDGDGGGVGGGAVGVEGAAGA